MKIKKSGSNAAKFAAIANSTSSKKLSTRLEIADNSLSRARGLMFRRLPASILFYFPSEDFYAIHSFFVPFEFDAIYLDANSQVSGVFESIRPFSLYISPAKKSSMLLELPPGSAKKLNAQIGDKISIKWRK